MSDKPARKPAWGWVTLALALGMLIWVRLRLVTDIPRSVYAEPGTTAPSDHPSAGPSDGPSTNAAPNHEAAPADPETRVATHPDLAQ